MGASARGIVITVFRGGCEVVCEDELREVHLTGAHARQELALAVGDEVRFDPASGRLLGIEPRRTRLERLRPRSRPGGGRTRRTQVIAANMDQVAIVSAVVEPPFVAGVVDRFLLAAAAGGLHALLVVNKLDLLRGEPLPAELADYEAVVPVVPVSARTGAGLPELREHLAGSRTVLAGHSGVGKSSLLNALDPSLRLETGQLRERDKKGRHTTSSATWYRVGADAVVVDTPGIRELATGPVDPRLLYAVYPDVAEHAADCPYRDCRHRTEPGCSVQAAVERGELSGQRLESFHKLAQEVQPE